jgi:uncharacterized cupin superfamily protein
VRLREGIAVPKIDIETAPTSSGTTYPEEHAAECKPRRRRRLGDAVGLDQFGVNLLRIPAGAWSSQRHWHFTEDEFVWVVSGEVVLVEGTPGEPLTETVLRAGDCAGFKAGVPNGHKIENRSDAEAVLLEVGTRNPTGDGCDYPDIDMVLPEGADRYFHRDGTPYPKYDRRT